MNADGYYGGAGRKLDSGLSSSDLVASVPGTTAVRSLILSRACPPRLRPYPTGNCALNAFPLVELFVAFVLDVEYGSLKN